MSADNEMIALRACGVSLYRVCMPVLVVGVLLSLFTFWINAQVAPQAEQAMRDSLAAMARSNPSALFVPDEVVDQFREKKIFIGGKDGETLTDVTLVEQNEKGYIKQIIHARRGQIEVEPDSGELVLTLEETRFEQRDEERINDLAAIRHGISVAQATISIPLDDLVSKGLQQRPLRSYTLGELRERFAEVRGGENETATLTEISKRFSMSMACIAFALIAMPLGVTAQRKETSVGFAISLALAFGYFFFVVLAEMLRDDATAFPYVLLWIPNILFIGIGAWMLLRLDHR